MSVPTVSLQVLELLRFTEAHNRHTEALARATGEHFNIFNVLSIGHLEVTTHSPILAELLNPKGNHGQGSAFLRLFLTQFEVSGFEADTATVKTEYHAGPKTEKSGGRMDIVVKDRKGVTILIENKIYASDQEKQMKRYRETYPTAHLFYLTTDGRNPSGHSEKETDRLQCRCISYAEEILAWLKECRKAAACLPKVRETLSQYIHLIEELTNQSTTILMNKELIEKIVDSPESLRAFYTLRDAEVAVRTELIARLDTKLDDLAKATGLKRQGPLRELHTKEGGFYFTTPGLIKRNLEIGFGFDSGNYREFYFGFAKRDVKQPCPVETQILSAFTKQFSPYKPTEYWPAWTWWTEYLNWGYDAFEAIRSGRFAEDLKAKLEILAKIARQVCPDKKITQKG